LERIEYQERWFNSLKRLENGRLLYLCGPADSISGRNIGDLFIKKLPFQKLVYLDNHISHWPQLEDPKSVLFHYLNFL
jgi:pimeloyl-ACP methyl ester carboxylesterase